jgi:polyisoprenyl-phosphate glycosyltransferase
MEMDTDALVLDWQNSLLCENMNPQISIVSPVYGGEASVEVLVKNIREQIESLSYEIILVEDASPDLSWEKIISCCEADERVKGIRLSRNFGQHAAVTAGLSAAHGEYIIIMDCDMQDDPAFIPLLITKAKEGYDIVYTQRITREFSAAKNLWTGIFYKIFNFFIDNPISHSTKNIGGYTIISRKACNAFLRINDYHRHYLMVLRWLGFRYTFIDIEHRPRLAGKSSYNFKKLVMHALNGITSQSNRLLYISVGLGALFCFIALVYAAYIIIQYFIYGSLAGYTSLMVVLLLSSGVMMLLMGIIGIYIGKIFDQVRGRPLYLIQETINCDTI